MKGANTFFWILRGGYFPKELPPNFSTTSFAKAMKDQRTSQLNLQFSTPSKHSYQIHHSLARAGGVRRMLGIPHPLFYAKLTSLIADNWNVLKRTANDSKFSQSKPQLSSKGRALQPVRGLGDLAEVRAVTRNNSRYILQTDISEFYRSFYTHSIPWALHGKAKAKASKHDSDLLGNQIDKALRICQDHQTNGIPVGPDISFLMAEILLNSIDRRIVNRKSDLKGFRFYDDFEFSLRTLTEAEETLALLQFEFAEMGLQLNPNKTKILDAPSILNQSSIRNISEFHSKIRIQNSRQLIDFFDQLVEIHSKDKASNIFSYAMPIFANCEEKSWNLAQSLMSQSLVAEPSSAQSLVIALLEANQRGRKIDKEIFYEAFYHLITRSQTSAGTHESTWAIWGSIELNLKIEDSLIPPLLAYKDPILVLTLLHAHSRGLLTKKPDVSKWLLKDINENLYTENWLLTYEGVRNKWLDLDPKPIKQDPFFGHLLKADVGFYRNKVGITVEQIKRYRSTQHKSYEDDENEERFDTEKYDF